MGGAARRTQPTVPPRSHVDYVQFVPRDPWVGAASSGVGTTVHASARRPAGHCPFVVLQARVRGRRQLPCVHSCMNRAGSQCQKAGGHQCSLDTTAIDGGALEYGARTEAARIDRIDERLARAIVRSWRVEWGAQLPLEELMQHGVCRHAQYQFSKELSLDEEEEPMEDSAVLTVPAAGLPTDTVWSLPRATAVVSRPRPGSSALCA
eukprot:COSAG02_NODE_110_length_36062_cov_85.812106_17_plen_207_part_00